MLIKRILNIRRQRITRITNITKTMQTLFPKMVQLLIKQTKIYSYLRIWAASSITERYWMVMPLHSLVRIVGSNMLHSSKTLLTQKSHTSINGSNILMVFFLSSSSKSEHKSGSSLSSKH